MEILFELISWMIICLETGLSPNFIHAFICCYFIFGMIFDSSPYNAGGRVWVYVQNWSIWTSFAYFMQGSIGIEEKLDSNGQYIFGSFPHGAYSIHHFLTMTNGAGMFSTVFPDGGDKLVHLVASVLFFFPGLRELLLWLGCVDASKPTAIKNLDSGKSLLIFVGGEKEQLLTCPGHHRIYIKKRKGFVKLALRQSGKGKGNGNGVIRLVPTYAFGENDAYHVCTIPFVVNLQNFLQKYFSLGIPIAWGRYGSVLPLPVPIAVEIGKPIDYTPTASAQGNLEAQVDELHEIFINEVLRLFDRTKAKHGYADAKLEIL
jgi:hypothetical protein